MVFPSFPLCLDPPNWNQQQALQLGNSSSGGGNEARQIPPPPCLVSRAEVGMTGSIRPGSMAARAQLAKLAGQPVEPAAALKCPRCNSTNTKFCYFNNYSLSQPRHFCKTCRRYWTRGGALRNVPVGGGCRRTKRIAKPGGSSSISLVASSTVSRQTGGASSSSATTILLPRRPPALTSLHPLSDSSTPAGELSFPEIQTLGAVDHQVGFENLRFEQQIQSSPMIFSGLMESLPQTQLQPRQPSLAPVPSIYTSFIGDGTELDDRFADQLEINRVSSTGLRTASEKMENNAQQLNHLPRHVWGGGSGGGGSGSGGWSTGFSSFINSSSTDHSLL